MSRQQQIVCFFEDIAHEKFIVALIKRAANEQRVAQPDIKVLNATQGSKVWPEFRQYLRDLQGGRVPLPDVLVVVIDGNCKGVAQVRQHIQQEVTNKGVNIPHLVCAVPNPHIERWYLEDQQAFKRVLPKAQPKKLRYKCERDRYKRALRDTIRAAGIEPLLGGAEYGEDIAGALEPNKLDRSFRDFWKNLCAALK